MGYQNPPAPQFADFPCHLFQRVFQIRRHTVEFRILRVQLQNRIIVPSDGVQIIRRKQFQRIEDPVRLPRDQVLQRPPFLFRIEVRDADQQLVALPGTFVQKGLGEEAAVVAAEFRRHKAESFALPVFQRPCCGGGIVVQLFHRFVDLPFGRLRDPRGKRSIVQIQRNKGVRYSHPFGYIPDRCPHD